MHVTLFGFVLFLHIFVAISAFMMAAVLHAALPALAKARDVREMRSWAGVVHRLEPLFPISALLLLGLGAWLIHLSDGEIKWSDGWLLTSLIALVVIEGFAGALLAPKAKAVVKAVEDSADGPVPPAVHQATVEPAIWHVGHAATFGFLGVVFLMAAKPGGVWPVVVVVVAVGIGLAVSNALLRGLSNVGATSTADGIPSSRRSIDEAVES